MMISNLKKPFGLQGLYRNISVVERLIDWTLTDLLLQVKLPSENQRIGAGKI